MDRASAGGALLAHLSSILTSLKCICSLLSGIIWKGKVWSKKLHDWHLQAENKFLLRSLPSMGKQEQGQGNQKHRGPRFSIIGVTKKLRLSTQNGLGSLSIVE